MNVVFYQRYNNFWGKAYQPNSHEKSPEEIAAGLAELKHVTAVCIGEDRPVPPVGKDLQWIKEQEKKK